MHDSELTGGGWQQSCGYVQNCSWETGQFTTVRNSVKVWLDMETCVFLGMLYLIPLSWSRTSYDGENCRCYKSEINERGKMWRLFWTKAYLLLTSTFKKKTDWFEQHWTLSCALSALGLGAALIAVCCRHICWERCLFKYVHVSISDSCGDGHGAIILDMLFMVKIGNICRKKIKK